MESTELIDTLPQSLIDIADVIGLPAALNLAHKIGGTRVRVPVKYTPNHSLARMLGYDCWYNFWHMYQGQWIDLPRNQAYIAAVRNSQIIAQYEFKTVREIALEHSLTERMIYKIVAGRIVDDEQMDLFQN